MTWIAPKESRGLKLEMVTRVNCRRCGARPRDAGGADRPEPSWARISGLRCERCRALLDADDIAHLLLEKQSQLERFGLLKPPTVPRRALRLVRMESD